MIDNKKGVGKMSLILCPECGTKISDKATKCPHCGFESADPLRPISEQDKYESVPIFEYDIEEWKPNRGDLSIISYEDNRSLVNYFGKWETIKTKIPIIAEVINLLAKKENVMVAKMDGYVKNLIKKGVYRFTVDKNGNILPTIRDENGYVKQVRLEEMTMTPNLAQSLKNLSTHAALARILDKIECVGDAIRDIHIELQNDRLAKAESSRDIFKQAQKIQDATLRNYALLDAANNATDAKRILMRNFSQNMNYIDENSQKTNWQTFKSRKNEKDISSKAIDAFQSLVYITNAVQTECEAYALMGEYDSCRECLYEFKLFIKENNLDARDTLLLLNENTAQKKETLVNEFCEIAERITNFDISSELVEGQMIGLLVNTAR